MDYCFLHSRKGEIFYKSYLKFQFQPEVDLFASRLNAQLPVVFVSFHPDLQAIRINAFSLSWWNRPSYAFPPFAVIGKVLHKLVLDVATGIMLYRIGQNSYGIASG